MLLLSFNALADGDAAMEPMRAQFCHADNNVSLWRHMQELLHSLVTARKEESEQEVFFATALARTNASRGALLSAFATFVHDILATFCVVSSNRPAMFLNIYSFIYLKYWLLAIIDKLRVYLGKLFFNLQSDSLAATVLKDCGMTFMSDEVVTGGFAGSVRRIYLRNREDEDSPGSIIIKSVSTTLHMRSHSAMCGVCQREVRFYNEISRTLPIPVPEVYFSEWKDWRCYQLIVMEDIRMGIPALDRLLTPAGAKTIVQEVMLVAARIHAKYWGATPSTLAKSSLGKYSWLKGYDYIQGRSRGMYEYCKNNISACWDEVKAAISEGRLGDRQYEIKWSPELVKFIDKAIEDSTWDAYQKYLKTHKHPLTLVHGDYHAGNQLWVEKTKKLYTVDWSAVSVGEGPADLAGYFFFPHTARYRQWESELISIYWNELRRQGVNHSSYPLSMCREAYVRGGIDRGIQ
ncbi:hypothetical protein FOL47_010812, partial [Perkinsus chesapeaki]